MTIDPALSAQTPDTLTACVDGVCHSQPYVSGMAPSFVAVSPVKDAEVTVSVSLAAGTRSIFTGSTTTRPRKAQPNGPGCDPTVWQAQVSAHANGQLSG